MSRETNLTWKGIGTRAVIVAALVVVGTVALVASVGAAGARSLAAPSATPAVVTCSVTVNAENGADNAIQSAVNTYPGGTICIGPGTFPEQITISASGTTLRGAGAARTIIEPNSGSGAGTLTFNTVDWDSAPYAGGVTCGSSTCVPLAAIILVASATPPPASSPTTGVTIEDLQVNGAAGSSNVACGDDYVGVDFQDASGTLKAADVLNVASPASSFGCQEVSGAVYAYNGYFYSDSLPSAPLVVTVSHTTVTGYQKNGLTCDDPAEHCTFSTNTVTGIGPTDLNAQNGIQVAYGALAKLTYNKVSENSYSNNTGGSTNDWYTYGYAGTGVLLYDSGTGTTVSYNTVFLNQIGIVYVDDGSLDGGSASTTISHNTVDTSNAYGIVANGASGGGDSVTIALNTINNEATVNPTSGIWGAPGILVDTGSFSVTGNHILGSSTASGSSNGKSQTVCGPDGGTGTTGTPILVCSSYANISTAAIQGVSESGSGITNLNLGGNVYTADSVHLATLGVLGGSVNVEEVS
jgi:hypothetical protein